MEVDLPSHVAGLWTGQFFSSNGTTEPTCASLAFLAQGPAYPSIFGATLDAQDRVGIVHGSWQRDFNKVNMKEITDDGTREMAGSLSRGDGGDLLLRGEWCKEIHGVCAVGGFVFLLEKEDSSVQISGLWVGKAAVDDALADFCIPANPIYWSLAARRTEDDKNDFKVFGAGFFDDSGDIPNQSLLFFSLHGKWSSQLNALAISKIYEKHESTEGYEVLYNGTLDCKDDEWTMKGTWKNEQGGSYGLFSCTKSESSHTSAALVCDSCKRVIPILATRWNCTICSPEWNCCSQCLATSDSCSPSHSVTRVNPSPSFHPHPLEAEVVYSPEVAGGESCAQLVHRALINFNSRPLLGQRESTASSTFTWLTYGELGGYVQDAAWGLRHLVGKLDDGVEKGKMDAEEEGHSAPVSGCIALCADNSPPYVAAMLAAMLLESVVVPIHPVLDIPSLMHIIAKTSPLAVFVGEEYVEKLKPLLVKVPTVIILPKKLTHTGHNASFLGFHTLCEVGRKIREAEKKAQCLSDMPFLPLPLPPPPSTVRAVLFTSGSTGMPKGAMYTEKLLRPTEHTSPTHPFLRFDFQTFHPSFLLSLLQTMHLGGRRVAAVNLTTIMEDLQLARPSHVSATPLFWNSLMQNYSSRVAERMKTMGSQGVGISTVRNEIEDQVAAEMRREFGNRLRGVTSGGASVSAKVLQFVRKSLQVDIVDAYGSRETGGIANNNKVNPGVDVKLIDIPEMGYFATGDPPRGEIAVRSSSMIAGYWNEAELNSKCFVQIDGATFYRTGDIGEYDPATRNLEVIERSGAVLKLAQGEWVVPTKIESVLEENPLVAQALVLGDPLQSLLIAIIIPSPLASHVTDAQLLNELRIWSNHHHLRPIEIPQALFLEHTAWTSENGFLTATEKKRRLVLTKHYAEIAKGLYSQLENGEYTEMTSLFSERFENILHQVVPPGLSLEPHFRLPEIGCDSLSVARLLHLLHKEGVNISILQLYEYPLSHLSEIVDAASTTPYLSLPVVNKTTSWEAEWQLPTDIVSSKIRIPKDVQKCILVTGCTGFLGPVLVAEIIKQYPPNVKLFCLVRAHTNEEAARRLQKDMVAAGIWDEGYTSRIKVVRGNLAKPKFALSDEDHTEIINNISDIYHSGAWVNMSIPYSGLAPTNVGGTLSVIRMACEGGFRVHYVSSANVLTDNYVQEDWLPLSSHHLQHKSGYAQTKIVSEKLLQAAAQSRNLSVNVYRVSSISGHTCTPFHNSHDWIVYLLRACARVGGVVGDTSVRLNWLPVDFVARAIVEFSRATGTYGQVVNLIGDGPNLRDIFEEMKEVLHLRDMTSSQWRLHIRETIVDQSDGLFHMVDSLSLYQFKVPSTGIVYPTNKIRSHLKTSWPVISKTLIRKYINDIFGTEDSKKGNS